MPGVVVAAGRRYKVEPLSPAEAVAVARMRWHDVLEQAERVLQMAAGAQSLGASLVEADGSSAAVDLAALRAKWDLARVGELGTVEVFVPMTTRNEGNERDTANNANRGGKRARRTKGARRDVYIRLRAAMTRPPPLPARVVLTRLSSGLLDDDGVPSALKAVRDAVACEFFGRDDRDPRLFFRPEQRKCNRGQEGVLVSITHGYHMR